VRILLDRWGEGAVGFQICQSWTLHTVAKVWRPSLRFLSRATGW